MSSLTARIVLATLVAGTLDIIAATFFAGLNGMRPVQVLQFVASGPLGDHTFGSPNYAAAGLAVHFAIMAAMVTAYAIGAPRLAIAAKRPVVAGTAYGFALWIVMNCIVVPLRWPQLAPTLDAARLAEQLFCHIVLVGIPIALILRPRRP